MRTITKNIYQFHELPEDIQNDVIESFRDDMGYHGFAWDDAWRDSLSAIEKELGITIVDWQVSPYNNNYRIARDNVKSAMRGRKLKEFNPDYMPTGYCGDCEFWHVFYNVWSTSGNPVDAVDSGLESFFSAWQLDQESQLSDEYIINFIECNQFEFDEDGERV